MQQAPLKRRYSSTRLHVVTSQKATIFAMTEISVDAEDIDKYCGLKRMLDCKKLCLSVGYIRLSDN
jgi:hypothetical protein